MNILNEHKFCLENKEAEAFYCFIEGLPKRSQLDKVKQHALAVNQFRSQFCRG